MSEKQFPLQDKFLEALQTEGTHVSIYLANGIRLIGKIEAFDAYVVLLKSETSQLIYKHSIATVVPAHAVNYFDKDKVNGNVGNDRPTTAKKPTIIRKRSPELA